MRVFILSAVLFLSACARREPIPYSYTTVTHYGYTNPNHVMLNGGYNAIAPSPPSAPSAPQPSISYRSPSLYYPRPFTTY